MEANDELKEEQLHRLNTIIKESEEKLFDRKEEELRMHKTKDLVLLELLGELEEKFYTYKDKSLSNIEKRTIIAEKNPALSKLKIDIELFHRSTAIMEIELNYTKRLFQIALGGWSK